MVEALTGIIVALLALEVLTLVWWGKTRHNLREALRLWGESEDEWFLTMMNLLVQEEDDEIATE